MPPNGGFGGNTGIHDVHNLACKLALVIKGQASPNLLASYERERKPVAKFTVEQAFSRYVTRTAPWLQPSQQIEPVVPDFDIELGYLYESPTGTHADPRSTFGMPGSRAPHLWLSRRDERVSTRVRNARITRPCLSGSPAVSHAAPVELRAALPATVVPKQSSVGP
jgi:putative polyketide hydroxylase